MEEVKTVGVKVLKNQLSAYLRDVKAGCVVLITERGSVVAELHQPVRSLPLSAHDSIKTQWINNGKLTPTRSQKRKCSPSPITSNSDITLNLLNQERDD